MITNEIKISWRRYRKTKDVDHLKDIFRLLKYKLVGVRYD